MPLGKKTGHKPFLTQTDLEYQMVRMMKFMDHEAKELAEDIDNKSQGEYCYVKGRLIQEARMEMAKSFERRERAVVKKFMIQNAILRNEARLRLLGCKEAHIFKIEAAVHVRITEELTNLEFYREIMLKLVLQGLFRLLEEVVVVRVREEDLRVMEGLLETASIQYKKAVGSDVTLYLDKTFIPPSSLGGVNLFTPNRRTILMNTLQRRLEDIIRHLIPEIRHNLFID